MSTPAPLVSVIVPTYERPELFLRAIESVRSQSYDPIELVVVEGPSKYPVNEILTQFQNDFHEIRHKRNDVAQGVPAARNLGINLARGEFIAFLDDDDRWLEEKITHQIATFENGDEKLGLVYTGVRQVGPGGRTNAIKTPTQAGDVLKRIRFENFIGTFSAVMIRSTVPEAIGEIDESLPAWEDWDFFLRIAREYDFGTVQEPLVIRESGAHTQSSDDYETRRDIVAPRFIAKHQASVSDGVVMRSKFRASVEYYLAQSAYAADRYQPARLHAFKAVRAFPAPRFVLLFLLLSGGRYTFLPAQYLKRVAVRFTE